MSATNILHITGQLETGGAERQMCELVTRLDRKKYNPMVCCLGNDGPVGDSIREAGIRVDIVRKRRRYDVTVIPRLIEVIKREKIDIVHTWQFTAGSWGRVAARLAGLSAVIFSERRGGFYERDYERLVDRILAKITGTVICNTRIAAQIMIKQLGISRKKVTYVYNGIGLDEFDCKSSSRQSRGELGLSPNIPVVGIIANLRFHLKGHRYFLRAARLVVQRIPRTRFLIIGDGAIRDQIVGFARDLNLSENVLFLGQRDDVPQLLSAVDVSVLASLREGFPNAIVESMAAARPVVATDVGGIPELVIHGKTGFLVPPKDPDAMAKSIIKLLQNKRMAVEMGLQGRKRIDRYFTMDRMIERYEHIYRHLMSD